MAWDKSEPDDDELLINTPGLIRANWSAIETGTDNSLQIDETKCHASMSLADSKLATISTAGKVDGLALTGLASLGAFVGDIPTSNLANVMKTSDAQTIEDVKTFTSFPVTPSSDPSSDYQIANKAYVDDNASVMGSFTNTDEDQVGGVGDAFVKNTEYVSECAGEVVFQCGIQSDNTMQHAFSWTVNGTTYSVNNRCIGISSAYMSCSSVIIPSGATWQANSNTGSATIWFRPFRT